MKLVCVFSFLLLPPGLSSIASRRNDFDHFWLVLTWAPTLCRTNPCKRDASAQFTIHGLWPVNQRGSTLRCPVRENANLSWFTDGSSRPLVQCLNMYWPNLLGDDDKEFWEDEWEKRGSTQGDFEPKQYFEKALSIRKEAGDIATALKNKGVVPTDNKNYPSTEFLDALKSVTGTDQVMLTCDTSTRALRELRICVDRDATVFIPCKKNEMKKASCKKVQPFIFPPP